MNRGRRQCITGLVGGAAAQLVTAISACAQDIPAWAANPATTRARDLLTAVQQAHWIQEGRGPRVVYVFFDPNCPYSHKLYLATREYVGRGGLALRWIPVGALERSSLPKAAAILQAPDPLRAFRYNEDNWDFGESPAGGIRPLADPKPAILDALRRNAQIMREGGLSVFPDLLFDDRSGQARLYVGLLPADALSTVLDAAGPLR